MHYQLYIPHQIGEPLGTAHQALERLGLGDMIAGHEGGESPGPGEVNQGLLIAWRKPGKNELRGFSPEKQTWIPSVANGPDGEGKGRYWVGFWNDSPVTPEDLQRPYSKPGTAVQLGDGNSWRLPIISELPKDLVLADDGTWRFELQRQYHDLNLQAMELSQRILENQSVNFADGMDFCTKALLQNYRLLPEVISHLRLFSTENIVVALSVLLGIAFNEQ